MVVCLLAVTGDGSIYLAHVLVILSIVSMTVGNLAAIVQKDLKRLLAYSAVAHAGYGLIGILGMSSFGYASVIFYAMAMLVMKFTAFLVVVKVADDGSNLQMSQLAGLHRRSPLLALALMVSVFSLAGIPPTIGFTGKFLLFIAAMEKRLFYTGVDRHDQRGYLPLLLLAHLKSCLPGRAGRGTTAFECFSSCKNPQRCTCCGHGGGWYISPLFDRSSKRSCHYLQLISGKNISFG